MRKHIGSDVYIFYKITFVYSWHYGRCGPSRISTLRSVILSERIEIAVNITQRSKSRWFDSGQKRLQKSNGNDLGSIKCPVWSSYKPCFVSDCLLVPLGQLVGVIEAQDRLDNGNDQKLQDQTLPEEGIEWGKVLGQVEVGQRQVKALEDGVQHIKIVLERGLANSLEQKFMLEIRELYLL